MTSFIEEIKNAVEQPCGMVYPEWYLLTKIGEGEYHLTTTTMITQESEFYDSIRNITGGGQGKSWSWFCHTHAGLKENQVIIHLKDHDSWAEALCRIGIRGQLRITRDVVGLIAVPVIGLEVRFEDE